MIDKYQILRRQRFVLTSGSCGEQTRETFLVEGHRIFFFFCSKLCRKNQEFRSIITTKLHVEQYLRHRILSFLIGLVEFTRLIYV